ncbi:hypothetical protein NDU88_002342 [Pleurodeles waltl]|uniref:Uncharacterized protein n=1 Tax=Pleurodeles waltl TaxID=8319 RepID=A0AAV7TKB6_PLEWA|nr:hypothetical protein NDU88_002342 [Pleurodeles waltl]
MLVLTNSLSPTKESLTLHDIMSVIQKVRASLETKTDSNDGGDPDQSRFEKYGVCVKEVEDSTASFKEDTAALTVEVNAL